MKDNFGEKYSIPEIYKHLGGNTTPDNNFMITLDYSVPDGEIGAQEPYRAEGAGILFCTRGSTEVSVNLRELNLVEGTVMLYGGESIVEFKEVSDDFVCHIIFFSQRFASDALVDLKTVLPIIKYVTDNESELILLDDREKEIITKYYELIDLSISFERSAIIRDLMVAFVRALGEIYNSRLSDSTFRVKTRQEEYLENFLREVAEHHKKERSVKFYADQLHITPKYLSTVIKEVSGESATTWINKFVIQNAKVLLKFSPMSIQEITYELNFSTQSFFGKYFKRHTGVSPSEYRTSD